MVVQVVRRLRSYHSGRAACSDRMNPMSRLVPHSLSLSSTMFWKRLIKNENLAVMNLHYKGKKQLLNGEALLWADIANPSEKRKPKYIDEISVKPVGYTLAAPITQSTLGWNITANGKMEPMFIFLKSRIDSDLQANALKELKRKTTPFKSCAKSGRPELKQAVRYNGLKDPEASEWNPGFREKKRYGCIEPVSDLTPYPELRALLEQMSVIFRVFFSRKWGHAFTMCPEPFRLKGKSGRSLPYSRLAILKSAASAVHLDGDNGMGVACMTTIEDPDDPYKGGTFCFVEYGLQIAVRPGDMLIANTPEHWHCNVGKIIGTKYSIVAYFSKRLASQIMNDKWREQTGDTYETFKEREARQWGRLGRPVPKGGMFAK
jgi:hypothetical protein